MRPTQLLRNNTLQWVMRLYDPEDGITLIDADSTPTVAVRKNGSAVGDSVTVTKRAATTGIYDCSYNPASEVEGDQFTLEESATIGGDAYQHSWEFSVKVAEGSVTDWSGLTNKDATVELPNTNIGGLSAAERTAIAAAILDLADAIETGLTLRQAQRLCAAAVAGVLSGAATTEVVIRNAVANSKTRITATVDADGNRTAIATDVT